MKKIIFSFFIALLFPIFGYAQNTFPFQLNYNSKNQFSFNLISSTVLTDDFLFQRDSKKSCQNYQTSITIVNDNQPCFENNGLLIETANTNLVSNSTLAGASVSGPGATGVPTGWSWVGTQGGVTREITGIGSEFGLNYMDVRFYGTATNNLTQPLYWGIVPATIGQSYTSSIYSRLVSGSMANFPWVRVGFDELNASTTYLAGRHIETTNFTSSFNRYTHTFTTANASTSFVVGKIQFTATSGTAVNATFRLYGPMLNRGSIATSWVSTTTAPQTSVSDTITINRTLKYPLSVSVPFILRGTSGTQVVFQADDGTNTNRLVGMVSGSSLLVGVDSSGTRIATVPLGAVVSNTLYKLAISYNSGIVAGSVNGGSITTVNSGATAPGITHPIVGCDRAGNCLNGWVRGINVIKKINNLQVMSQ